MSKEEVKSYIVLQSDGFKDIEEQINTVSAQAYYLKFFEVTDEFGYVAVMSQKELDKYFGVIKIEDVSTTQDANRLLTQGWIIVETWKDKIRMILRKKDVKT